MSFSKKRFDECNVSMHWATDVTVTDFISRRIITRKHRCRYSRKRAKICQKIDPVALEIGEVRLGKALLDPGIIRAAARGQGSRSAAACACGGVHFRSSLLHAKLTRCATSENPLSSVSEGNLSHFSSSTFNKR